MPRQIPRRCIEPRWVVGVQSSTLHKEDVSALLQASTASERVREAGVKTDERTERMSDLECGHDVEDGEVWCRDCQTHRRLAASSLQAQLRALIARWREEARLIRPLESAPISAEKRNRVAQWMMYTNRANELEALLVSSQSGAQEPTHRS